MRKIALALAAALILVAAGTGIASADKPVGVDANGNEIAWADTGCASIQDGTILDSTGNPLSTGYDVFGYNYQAHMFNGTYDSVDRVLDGKYWGSTGDYVDDTLMMKWSDEWIANVDCNGDHKLDRGLVNGVVGGVSLGWETNHVEGDYDSDGDGIQDAHYTYFVKIVWTGPGSALWGQYSIVQEGYQEPSAMSHWHATAPGFGLNDQWTVIP